MITRRPSTAFSKTSPSVRVCAGYDAADDAPMANASSGSRTEAGTLGSLLTTAALGLAFWKVPASRPLIAAGVVGVTVAVPAGLLVGLPVAMVVGRKDDDMKTGATAGIVAGGIGGIAAGVAAGRAVYKVTQPWAKAG